MRLAHLAHSTRQRPVEGIHNYNALFYVWREGYLLVSPSRQVLREALQAPVFEGPYPAHPRTVTLDWQGLHPGALALEASAELPVAGRIQLPLLPRERVLPLPRLAPEPIATLHVSSWDDVQALARLPHRLAALFRDGDEASRAARTPALPGAVWEDLWAALFNAWGLGQLPGNWDEAADMLSLALAGIHQEAEIPMPEVVLGMRAMTPAPDPDAHPLLPLANAGHTLPYAWGETPGSLTPVWGPPWTLALSTAGADWVAASREPVMERLLAGYAPGPSVAADLLLTWDWGAAARPATGLLRSAAAYELLPELNERELGRELLPLLDALGQLGHAHLEGQAQEDWLHFAGSLTAAEPFWTTLPAPAEGTGP